jgi:hypothetical protein
MTKSSVEFRIKRRVVYDLEYKDEFGRWIRHSSHNIKKLAELKIKGARSTLTKLRKWKESFDGRGLDPGRERKFSIHGEDM